MSRKASLITIVALIGIAGTLLGGIFAFRTLKNDATDRVRSDNNAAIRSGDSAVIRGQVVNEKGRAVANASIDIEGLKIRPITDENGMFLIDLPDTKNGDTVRIFVSNSGHTSSAVMNVTVGEAPLAVLLKDKGFNEGKIFSVSTNGPPSSSGFGANWSSWYEICQDAAFGAEIEKSTFVLTGDRSCGAYAECMEDYTTPNRACWRYRMQGHSESINAGSSISQGTLTTLQRRFDSGNP